MIRVLVVDDEEPYRRLLKKELGRKGFSVETAHDGSSALDTIRAGDFDVILLDIMMPGMDGIAVMRKLKSQSNPPVVVVLTGKATVETAVEAMRQGAYDYLTKPCMLDEIEIVINRAHDYASMSMKTRILEQELMREEGESRLVGSGPAMSAVHALIKKVATTDSTVLVTGESGTGKELATRALWRMSRRAERPLVTLNCAALSEGLLESELFGHEKGAFTSAHAAKYGIVEAADGGTLFLDEIGELPISLQSKFLRFLDTGEFRRVGGTKSLRADVRLIAATNRDLRALVEDGRFREDLFYRLNVINIALPPLRARKEDIAELVLGFIRKYARKISSPAKSLDADALQRLMAYGWPGNVRELENVIERSVVLADGDVIKAADLAISEAAGHGADTRVDDHRPVQLDDMERNHIERILSETAGNQSRAAAMLGINRKTLYLKMRKYGIKDAE